MAQENAKPERQCGAKSDLEDVKPLEVVTSDVESFAVGAETQHIVGDVAGNGSGDALCVQRQVHASFIL